MTQEITVMQKVRARAKEMVYSYSADTVRELREKCITSMDIYKYFDIPRDCGYDSYTIIAAWEKFVDEFIKERFPEQDDPLKDAQRQINKLLEDEDRKLSIAFGILFDALQKKEMNNEN